MKTMEKKREVRLTTPRSFLATMDIFEGLPASQLAELGRRLVEKKFAKHESILLEGDPAEFVWFVKSGHVKTQTHAASGRCQTLCLVGPGKMFGSCCSLGKGQYVCQALAESDVTVVSCPMDDFLSILSKNPALASKLAVQLSHRLRHSMEFQVFEQESVEKRILRVLVDLTAEFGLTIPLTRREIAEMVGTTVETSIRTFSKLEEEGLVATERGKITVPDLDELTDRLDEI